MLPRSAYVDPAVFAWEQKYFFDSGWTCVGFSSQLAEPGAQRAESVGEGSVLLTRDDEGELHAFANTCRHRGHELLACGTSTSQNSIICPYHSWTYTLSGGLRFATGFRGHKEGETFEADLTEAEEKRAKERGSIRVIRRDQKHDDKEDDADA